MLVSIIIPVYNAQNFLNKAVNSVLLQTYTNLELILIDDGSMDESLKICNKWAESDERIRVFNQINQGSSVARNTGLKAASGDYIMFVDADDYIEPNMVAELIKLANGNKVDLVISNLYADYYDINGGLVKTSKREIKDKHIEGNKKIAEEIVDLFELEIINGPTCKLIKSEIIKSNKIEMPTGIHLQEDLHFNVDILNACDSLIITNNAYYHYNHYQIESVTTKYYKDKWEMLNSVNDKVLKYYTQRTKDSNILKRIYFLNIKNTYASFLNMFHKDNQMSKKEKLLFIKKVIMSEDFKNKLKNANKGGTKYKLLKLFLKTEKAYFIYYLSKLLHWMKYELKMRY